MENNNEWKTWIKKPIGIKAIHLIGIETMESVLYQIPNSRLETDEKGNTYLIIPTLEGEMKANEYDYIIKGVNGEFYPCKPEIFNKTYEYSDF